MHMPGGQAVTYRLLADLVFGHRGNDLVVHQQSIHIQRLVAGRIGCLKLDRTAAFRIFDTGQQRCLIKLVLMLEFFHVPASCIRLPLLRGNARTCHSLATPRRHLRFSPKMWSSACRIYSAGKIVSSKYNAPVLLVGLMAAAIACAITVTSAIAGTTTGNVAGWVKNATLIGPAPTATQVTIAVHMTLTDIAGLQALVTDVS